MGVRFAKAYVDEVFAARDLDRVCHLISLVDQEPNLPEELWLFSRVYEWAPSRSGIWQYYEALPETLFLRIKSGLERYGFDELAAKFAEGRYSSGPPTFAEDFDDWLEEHASAIHAALFQLILPKKDYLIQAS